MSDIMKTRVRHSFGNADACAHAWAHALSDYGKAGNVSFLKNSHLGTVDFYSYATVIARRFEHKGEPVFIINSATYSPSTSRHQRSANSAAFGSKLWRDFGSWSSSRLPVSLADARDEMFAQYKKEPEHSRYTVINAGRFVDRVRLLDQAIDFCKLTGLSHKKLSSARENVNDEFVKQEAIHKEEIKKKELKRRALWEKRRKAAEVRQRAEMDARIAEFEGDVTALEVSRWYSNSQLDLYVFHERPDLKIKWQAELDRRSKLTLIDWLKGKDVYTPYRASVMLRVCDDGKNIETSRSATVPYEDGKQCYLFASGRRIYGWKRNGETCRVGHFQLDEVTDKGITAGCHFIEWSELDRFAKQEGWIE